MLRSTCKPTCRSNTVSGLQGLGGLRMNTIFSTSFTRLARGLATISIIPALFLPFYQAFLHGGRSAVDINPRAAAYMAVHVLGAYCLMLATCGVVAIYLKYHARIGKIAPFSLILALLAFISYA